MRSAFEERRRPPNGRAVVGVVAAAWFLAGPNDSKLRNERNEGNPPAEAGGLEPVWWTGLPLTARCRVGGTRPRWGVDNELGREL